MIKIEEKNYGRIESLLEEVQARCTARLVNLGEILSTVRSAEKALAFLPKRMWIGTVVTSEVGKVPNSYKFKAEGTTFRIEYRRTGWFFNTAKRVGLYSTAWGAGRGIDVRIPKEDPQDLLKRCLKHLGLS